VDTQPTISFQRVIQRAILHVQATLKKEVTGADVLVAICGEEDCHAVRLLQRQGVTPLDVANYVSHGVTKAAQPHQSEAIQDAPATTGRTTNRELEVIVQAALAGAREKRHEFVTVEHLLLALVDNPTAGEVLRACGATMDELRENLTRHVTEHTPCISVDGKADTEPTLGFQRVIQRAILHVQSSSKTEVTGANVLVAIFGEKDSHAVFFLHHQGITRPNVVSYMSHGVVSPPVPAEAIAAGDVQVVLHDDESTPMEFLARVLQEFFGMDKEEAAETMLEVYRDGKAVCGLYSKADGEALVRQVSDLAQANGHPLVCTTAAPKLK
jgi:ATP-dependent Clp protease ATP-binding subunit ClpA